MPDGSEKSSFVAAGHVRINRYAKPVFIPCFYGLGKLRVVHFEVRFRVMVLCAFSTPVWIMLRQYVPAGCRASE
jgi:hypothetical protein